MGRKTKFSKEVKLKAINEYNSGMKSFGQIANDLGCNKKTVMSWVRNYDSIGESAFDSNSIKKSYSKQLKMSAIHDYLNGEGSYDDITKKYNIYSKSTLISWVMKYNSHKEIKEYNPKGDVYMIKSRKTTFEDKLIIVKYCIDHNREYKLAAEHFNLPYSQVYQWVKKYDEKGKDGLKDGRGRKKQESELSETDKLKRKLEISEARNRRLEMENEVIKKLDEVERRLSSTKSGKKRNTSQSKN